MEAFSMDISTWMSPNQKKQLQAVITATVREEERKKAADKYAKLAQEYALKEKALKRKAAEALEDFRVKEDIMSYLTPPKSAKNDYVEKKPAKYVFKCMDGDIQIPAYGIYRTDFYNKDRISYLEILVLL